MKTLIILRHAKTERDHPYGDRHRELTARGRRDAASAAAAVAAGAGNPDLVVTSTAERAVQTTEIVVDALAFTGPVRQEPTIYAAHLDTLIDVVRTLPDGAATVLIVGHNPGFLDLINWFLGDQAPRDHLPTSGFAIVESPVDAWQDVGPQNASVSPIVGP